MSTSVHEALQAKLALKKEVGVKEVTSDLKVEDYLKMANAEKIISYTVPWQSPKVLMRAATGRTLVPCMALALEFSTAIFKSSVREEIGQLREGVSVDVMGFDIARDAEGKPLLAEGSTEDNPIFIPIDMDENDNPISPKALMTFRLNFGVDRDKSSYNRLRNQDQLNLSAHNSVPRKNVTVTDLTKAPEKSTTGTPAKPNYYNDETAWELLPDLKDAIRKPILNATLLDDKMMQEIIASIPISSNAPSKRALNKGTTGDLVPDAEVTKVVTDMDDSSFAPPPEKAGKKK